MVVTDLRFSDDLVMKDLDFVLCFQKVCDLPCRCWCGYQSSTGRFFPVFRFLAPFRSILNVTIYVHSAMGRGVNEAKVSGFYRGRH